MTPQVQLTLPIFEPAPPPREYRWYDWQTALGSLTPYIRMATPDIVRAMTNLLADCTARYAEATHRQPLYLILNDPAKVLGLAWTTKPDGTSGELAGLTVLMDRRIPITTLGLADTIEPTEPVPTTHARWATQPYRSTSPMTHTRPGAP